LTSLFNAYYQAVRIKNIFLFREYYEPYLVMLRIIFILPPDGLSIFFRDITEEKTAETAIENNEKYFRALVENNEAIITVLNQFKTIFRSPFSSNHRIYK
jgi:PAS domain-containing protein